MYVCMYLCWQHTATVNRNKLQQNHNKTENFFTSSSFKWVHELPPNKKSRDVKRFGTNKVKFKFPVLKLRKLRNWCSTLFVTLKKFNHISVQLMRFSLLNSTWISSTSSLMNEWISALVDHQPASQLLRIDLFSKNSFLWEKASS